MKHFKKFHFYVNRCPDCLEMTYVSLRPHKNSLCKKCSDKYRIKYEEMKKEKKEKRIKVKEEEIEI
jgi:hypothetical protein